jgi:hypothetical protein
LAKTATLEAKTLRANFSKISETAVTLVKKFEAQIAKLEAEVAKEAKEQDLIMVELHKPRHLEKEAGQLEQRADASDKKRDEQASPAKKTRKDLRNARKKIAAIDTDSEGEEPPPPVKMNMAFEGMTAEDFTEEKKEQMIKDLAMAYGINDWRKVKEDQGVESGVPRARHRSGRVRRPRRRQKAQQSQRARPAADGRSGVRQGAGQGGKVMNPNKALKAELEAFKGRVADDEARIGKLHASLGELDADLATAKAALREASVAAEKASARAAALEGAVAAAHKSIEALSGDDESIAQRLTELSVVVAEKELALEDALADKAMLEMKLENVGKSSGSDPGAQAELQSRVAELEAALAAAQAESSSSGGEAPGAQQGVELAEAQEMLLMLQGRVEELEPLAQALAEASAREADTHRHLAALEDGGGAGASARAADLALQLDEAMAAQSHAEAALAGALEELKEALSAKAAAEHRLDMSNREISRSRPDAPAPASGQQPPYNEPDGLNIDKTVRAVFRRHGADQDGAIDASELHRVLAGVGVQVSDAHVAETLTALDTNHSGKLELEEFAAWWHDRTIQIFALDDEPSAATVATAAAEAGKDNGSAVNPVLAGGDGEGDKVAPAIEDDDVNLLVASARAEDDGTVVLEPTAVTLEGGKPAGFVFELGGAVVKVSKGSAVAAGGGLGGLAASQGGEGGCQGDREEDASRGEAEQGAHFGKNIHLDIRTAAARRGGGSFCRSARQVCGCGAHGNPGRVCRGQDEGGERAGDGREVGGGTGSRRRASRCQCRTRGQGGCARSGGARGQRRGRRKGRDGDDEAGARGGARAARSAGRPTRGRRASHCHASRRAARAALGRGPERRRRRRRGPAARAARLAGERDGRAGRGGGARV